MAPHSASDSSKYRLRYLIRSKMNVQDQYRDRKAMGAVLRDDHMVAEGGGLPRTHQLTPELDMMDWIEPDQLQSGQASKLPNPTIRITSDQDLCK